MNRSTKTVSAITVVIALSTVTSNAWAGNTTTIKLGENPEYGAYLVDGAGNSLYLFEADPLGQSTCYDECAQEWPPIIATDVVKAGDGVVAYKLATTDRKDGTSQVTYDGHPLYQYAKDKHPGQTKGQDIKDDGAEWYLMHADGIKVGHEDERKS